MWKFRAHCIHLVDGRSEDFFTRKTNVKTITLNHDLSEFIVKVYWLGYHEDGINREKNKV